MNTHPVYFIAGKRGGRLKLGVRSLLGWEEGREGFVLGELALAKAGGGSIQNLQAPGQPPSPQPRWSSLEGHAAFLDSRTGTAYSM